MKIPTHVISTWGNLLQELVGATGNFSIHVKRFLNLFLVSTVICSSAADDVARYFLSPIGSDPRCREESRRKMAGEERKAAGVAAEGVGWREDHGRWYWRKRIHEWWKWKKRKKAAKWKLCLWISMKWNELWKYEYVEPIFFPLSGTTWIFFLYFFFFSSFISMFIFYWVKLI